MRDIWIPEPVSWWPLAPGWYGLALLMVAGLAYLLWRWRRVARARRYRVLALEELRALRGSAADAQDAVAALMMLLKRTALAAYPRRQVASLTGTAWWRFLDDSAGGGNFTAHLGPLAASLGYGGESITASQQDILDPLYDAAERWILNHRGAEEA
jgi:hypothetical protein